MENSHPLAFIDHDHSQCRRAALKCANNQGLRLTKWRQLVFDLLLEEHRSMGAYEILERLECNGVKPQPPTAYRALDFLVEHGLAHRIEKLNAYVACARPDACQSAGFIICEKCRIVAEVECNPSGPELLRVAADAGFSAKSTIMEVEGICHNCQKNA